MRALVIHAHPLSDGFSAALFSTAVDALLAGGHEVRSHQLYQEGFAAAMSPAEHHAYHTDTPIISDEIQQHADDLLWAQALVFIYPTWWAGLPAILKGWLEVLPQAVGEDQAARCVTGVLDDPRPASLFHLGATPMTSPRKRGKIVKFFRITIQYGSDEYVVVPMEPNVETTQRGFRLRKLTEDGDTYEIHITNTGAECNCPGFYYRKQCKHCRMLQIARLID